jgi:hypothetical protein
MLLSSIEDEVGHRVQRDRARELGTAGTPTASALTLVRFSVVADETDAPLGLVLGTLGQA